MHIFDIYRRCLLLVCGIYAVAKLCQAVSVLVVRQRGESQVSRLARSYLLTMLVSVRLSRFRGRIIQILLLLLLLAGLVWAHGIVMELW